MAEQAETYQAVDPKAVKWHKVKKAQKALKQIFSMEDQTLAWYVQQTVANLQTYPQLGNEFFYGKLDMHVCIMSVEGQVKQYSKTYTRLTRYDPQWIGFYPSQYPWTIVVNEAGATEEITVNDMEQLKNVRNVKKGGNFWFGGQLYKMVAFTPKHKTDDSWGWSFIALAKNNEAIYGRKTLGHYALFNFGSKGTKTRQDFGSLPAVKGIMDKCFKNVFLNDEDGDPYFKQAEGAEDISLA